MLYLIRFDKKQRKWLCKIDQNTTVIADEDKKPEMIAILKKVGFKLVENEGTSCVKR